MPNTRSWPRLRQRIRLQLRRRIRAGLSQLDNSPPVEKAGETLTPNLRALRLAMTVSDLLLSMGVSANNVVSQALDVTETYCDKPVNVNISFDLIIMSQIRGIEYEPLTIMRPVVMRDINNMTIHAVQQLVHEIRAGMHSLVGAETALDKILSEPPTYPKWLPPLANTFIAPAVALMFSTNWRVISVTFVIALMVARLSAVLVRHAVAPFFRHVVSSTLVTLAAAVIAWLAHQNVGFFQGMDPTLIVVGGIFMLLSGLAVVGAVQDAIEEYYLTAIARILRVIMLTTAIVVGVIVGLYAARKMGAAITVSPNPLQLMRLNIQVIGGVLAAAAYALATQTRLRAILWAGVTGGCALTIMYASGHLGINIVPASGVAAAFVGLVASLFSRVWGTPTTGILAAGIVPLVPGLTIYTALMQLVDYPPGNPLFSRGVGTMFAAVGSALAIAAGASFGNNLGRPLHRHLTRTRNLAPFADFMRWQLRADFMRWQIRPDMKGSRLMRIFPRRRAEENPSPTGALHI